MSANMMANGDIRPARFVKISADHKVQECDANDRIFGVAQDGGNKAPIPETTTILAGEDGQNMAIWQEGEECLLEVGAAVTQNDRLKADADGKGVAIATTGTTIQHFGAVALQDGAADATLIRVRVQIGSERPALT